MDTILMLTISYHIVFEPNLMLANYNEEEVSYDLYITYYHLKNNDAMKKKLDMHFRENTGVWKRKTSGQF